MEEEGKEKITTRQTPQEPLLTLYGQFLPNSVTGKDGVPFCRVALPGLSFPQPPCPPTMPSPIADTIARPPLKGDVRKASPGDREAGEEERIT